MVVFYPIEIFVHSAGASSAGSVVCERGGQWHSYGSRVEPVMDDMPEWATLRFQAPVLTGTALASPSQHQQG